MGTNDLSIQICNSPSEAPNYNEIGGYKAANLKKAVVVKNGTEGGHSTVDLVFEDEKGQKYIAMITGRLLNSVTEIAGER